MTRTCAQVRASAGSARGLPELAGRQPLALSRSIAVRSFALNTGSERTAEPAEERVPISGRCCHLAERVTWHDSVMISAGKLSLRRFPASNKIF